jgi:hypothetical protein
LHSIKDHVRNEEHLEKFEVERNALPTIGMPMLNERFFSQMDAVIKNFLTPVILGKQRSQMNESVCYDTNRITEFQHLIEVSNFDVGLDFDRYRFIRFHLFHWSLFTCDLATNYSYFHHF